MCLKYEIEHAGEHSAMQNLVLLKKSSVASFPLNSGLNSENNLSKSAKRQFQEENSIADRTDNILMEPSLIPPMLIDE
ncbi:hypothetical protein BB561_005090 [Smittium simulii]|uniref:Uncharacterized protein n=1 Tax=Smittium simulii TaxID=133385 RepID=A0A2T9YCB5_9FUNG|nr:hypothetical protein BB561_005090 [Smittium simulii]